MVFTPYGAFGTRADELMKQVPYGRINQLINLPGDALVRLYSYQGAHAWELAEQRGYWTGSDHIWGDEGDFGWGPAYDWMRARMAEEVPEFSGDYPMWAWTKRPSAKPKPRKYRGVREELRLTVLVPRSRILFSDFDTWHSVLNQNLLCRTEEEWDRHTELYPHHWSMPLSDASDEEKADYRARYMASVEPSWRQCLVFEPTRDPKVIEWGYGSPKYFHIQACVDRIYWHEIVGVRRFPGKTPTPDREYTLIP